MERKLVEKEICPCCKNAFDCSKSKQCWCFEHAISSEMLEALEKEYDGCLCAGCLGRFLGQWQEAGDREHSAEGRRQKALGRG